MEELIVALHMHTVYSDGNGTHAELARAGLKAGVDALIITDHNVLVQDMEGYLQQGKKRLLTLVGEEVHDQTRVPGGNHLLIFGHNRELARFAPKPQQLIDQVRASNALSFIAHPSMIRCRRLARKALIGMIGRLPDTPASNCGTK